MNGVNIIWTDEGHHLTAPSFQGTFDEFYQEFPEGLQPIVINTTATPDEQLEALVGKAVVKFGLPEYLASEYSPQVNYNLVTKQDISQVEIDYIYKEINSIQSLDNIIEKRKRVNELKREVDEMLSRFVNNEELVTDLLSKIVKGEEISKTVVFCPGIDTCDELTELINQMANK